MKFLKLIALLLSAVFAFGLGCKDEEDTSCDANFLTTEVNGQFWEATEVLGFKGGTGGQISISAQSDKGELKTLQFGLPCDISTGDYDLTLIPGVWDYGAFVYPRSGGVDYSVSGTMNVAVHDTIARVLKGTFEFEISSGDARIDKGSFCVKY